MPPTSRFGLHITLPLIAVLALHHQLLFCMPLTSEPAHLCHRLGVDLPRRLGLGSLSEFVSGTSLAFELRDALVRGDLNSWQFRPGFLPFFLGTLILLWRGTSACAASTDSDVGLLRLPPCIVHHLWVCITCASSGAWRACLGLCLWSAAWRPLPPHTSRMPAAYGRLLLCSMLV